MGVHYPKLSALCMYQDDRGNVIEMTWRGDLTGHPRLRDLLDQINDYIGKQMPPMGETTDADL